MRHSFQKYASLCIVVFLSGTVCRIAESKVRNSSSLVPTAETRGDHELAGEVVSVEGTVLIRPDGRTRSQALMPAKPGDLIRSGDVINSASDGKIKILMKDRTILDLGPSALFKVDQFKANQGANREVQVNMMYGSLRAAVAQKLQGKGKFKLRTPSAVMGVRGTEFVVKSEAPADLKQVAATIANPERPVLSANTSGGEPATQVTVVQGRVDVEPKVKDEGRGIASLAPPVALTAGTQLTTQMGDVAPAQAVQVDTSQLAQIKETAKVKDNTFQKAIAIEPVSASGGSASGEVARQAVSTAVQGAVAQIPQMNIGNSGLGGTFGNGLNLSPVNQNFLQAGMMRTITVEVLAP